MRYTRVEIEGRPGHHATLAHQGGEYVEAVLTTPASSRTHQMRADDREDFWSMARILQHALDGFRGASGNVREYLSALEHLADR